MVGISLAVSGAKGEMAMKLMIPPQESHEETRPRRVLPLEKAEGALAGAVEEGAFGQISEGLGVGTAPAKGA